MIRKRARPLMASAIGLALVSILGLALAQGMMSTPSHGGFAGGYGMMGGGMMGSGMMGSGMMAVLPYDAEPLSDAVLQERLESAARSFGADVSVGDVMPFVGHSYAQLIGPDGVGLAEILVDRYSGIVTPEPGPNMMWNRRTGMGQGMGFGMGGWNTGPQGAEDRYGEVEARQLAEDFLDSYLPGAEVLASQPFPGYVTYDYGRDGRIDGMLSIHLASGQVWPHSWHGASLSDAHD